MNNDSTYREELGWKPTGLTHAATLTAGKLAGSVRRLLLKHYLKMVVKKEEIVRRGKVFEGDAAQCD